MTEENTGIQVRKHCKPTLFCRECRRIATKLSWVKRKQRIREWIERHQ